MCCILPPLALIQFQAATTLFSVVVGLLKKCRTRQVAMACEDSWLTPREVVDDSVCTGATLASVGALCRERGASEVRTLSLYCHPRHPSDYFYRHGKTPLVWPWGWEAD
jgi:hypoxanthine phosphoribosyltransferase